MKEKVVTSYYDYMCSLKRVLHKNDNFRETTRIRMIICKRPVHLHDHLQPRKGHEKCIIETQYGEMYFEYQRMSTINNGSENHTVA